MECLLTNRLLWSLPLAKRDQSDRSAYLMMVISLARPNFVPSVPLSFFSPQSPQLLASVVLLPGLLAVLSFPESVFSTNVYVSVDGDPFTGEDSSSSLVPAKNFNAIPRKYQSAKTLSSVTKKHHQWIPRGDELLERRGDRLVDIDRSKSGRGSRSVIRSDGKLSEEDAEDQQDDSDGPELWTNPPQYDSKEVGFTHYNVGVLLVSGTGSSFDLEKCSPAVDMAIDIVNELYLRPHKIRLHKIQKSYPRCDNSLTAGLAADMKFLSNVIAFIGPACGFALEPVARLSAYWNLPVVTGLGDQPPSTESEVAGDKLLGGLNNKLRINSTGVFGDKREYPTLTRLSYCQCRLKLVFDAICQRFKWRHLAVVYDKMDLFSFTVGRILINGLKDSDYEVYARDIDGTHLPDMDEALTEISSHARIVILSLQENLVREFMIRAHSQGYTNTGEWAFLDVELFKNKPSETNYWKKGDSNDFNAKEAYDALLTISLLMPRSPTWNNFSKIVKTRAAKDYNFSFPDDEEVNFFIGAFYDGVILLGMALNETLSGNGSVLDGQQITKKMWNVTFEGVTGNVTIDENGDRDGEFSILDMNYISGHFEVVGHFISQSGLSINSKRKIHWPGGNGPPPDIPSCGFLGNHPSCLATQASSLLPYVGAIVLVFTVFIVALIFYIYKKIKETASSLENWKCHPMELSMDLGESKPRGPLEEKESSRGSLSLGTGTGVGQNTFVPTATYKGVQVALRKLALFKRVEFTKQIVSEIRQVRDIQHENCARVVGFCLSSTDLKSTSEKYDQILILSEYCSRGSLRDVLLNVHIHLDWPFRLSLISDIVNGMTFLHSNVGPHGRLSSAKCLVDARFVVKISDFGLNSLLRFQKKEPIDVENPTKMFWIAPEQLTSPSCINNEEITLKGDIYSFGIILYEVASRALPYSSYSTMSPEDLVANMLANTNPPFRPEISEEVGPIEIRNLMQNCWATSPEDRPDFPLVKSLLKKMMKGTGTVSLVDDLLRRLEQHALHLEVLVDDKTRELEQEKRRSEDLLYQVLPRQVAQQLLRGETVEPESFDAVVDFLNSLYGTFDGILDSFDAYKVETIGDAYMVVSGAPTRNMEQHVSEIAYLSLAVLDAVKNFNIGHLPDEQLKIRIGIHTGQVCAGVVGQKMPHYCLFGDTVNVASRMESTGLPLKIHVSATTAEALEEMQGFLLLPRGEVLLKGKGVMRTYWLEGCNDDTLWQRNNSKIHSGSKESIQTKCSVSQHLYSHSPSYNITTICVTPAE